MQRRDINKETYRVGCRAIIQNKDLILLEYVNKLDIYTLPGGGLEPNETLEECLKREVLEETGYHVDIIRPTVTVYEYFIDSTWENHYFLCSLASEQQDELNLTKEEMKNGQELSWISSIDALFLFDSYESTNLYGQNILSREFIGLMNSI
ncbi:MAG: NUDIX domain-containing protein [Firmicutes bacterium]|nr:NUDIX domain-containing protein [Bacillota bacterium]